MKRWKSKFTSASYSNFMFKVKKLCLKTRNLQNVISIIKSVLSFLHFSGITVKMEEWNQCKQNYESVLQITIDLLNLFCWSLFQNVKSKLQILNCSTNWTTLYEINLWIISYSKCEPNVIKDTDRILSEIVFELFSFPKCEQQLSSRWICSQIFSENGF